MARRRRLTLTLAAVAAAASVAVGVTLVAARGGSPPAGDQSVRPTSMTAARREAVRVLDSFRLPDRAVVVRGDDTRSWALVP